MHDAVSKKATAEAVPEIIKQLKAAGYTFGVLSETSPTVHFQ
jgi:peptidoglycan/xylan/chitin deacetylase (PgdA/CDA1 family)